MGRITTFRNIFGFLAVAAMVALAQAASAGSDAGIVIPMDCTLSNRFTDIPAGNVWIQMDMHPSPYDGAYPPLVDESVAVMFYVNSHGNFVVHNGPASPNTSRSTNWVTLRNFNTWMNDAQWVKIGIYEDFLAKRWHLYANNTLIRSNIKFINPGLTNFVEFKIFSGLTTTFVNNVSVTISNKPVLTVTGSFTVSNKTYDGSTAAAIQNSGLALSGPSGGKDVKLMAVAEFSDKEVGAGKNVNLMGSWVAGDDAIDYSLSLAGAPTSRGDITKAKAITVTAANNIKEYDGTASATGMPTITEGSLVGGDTAIWSEVYAGKDAGTGKTLIPSGTVNGGDGESHYMGIKFVPIVTGTITRKTLSATLAPTISKVYDGTRTAHLAATNYSLSGFAAGETCILTHPATVGAYATADVGTGIVVTVALAATNFLGGVGGFSTNNYTLPAGAEGSVGEITKAKATVTLHGLTQKYNGAARTVTSTTVPAGLTVCITYDSSIWDPINVGRYAVTGAVNDANYQGTSTGTLTVTK
ncbi:MAG: YDG domain-containing protein [Kiritimatiellae bacterium]|nr:YDG domain-containing protein [Kiritimatiellia bacterium]